MRETVELLQSYGWPGNVRDLADAIERALIISQSESIEKEDLPMKPDEELSASFRPGLLAQIERKTILEFRSRNGGDRCATSGEPGISLCKLQYRLEKFGITGRG